MDIFLNRGPEKPGGFFGKFFRADGVTEICDTLERAYQVGADATTGKPIWAPKIPVGRWTCVRRFSPHFQRELFMLMGVPNHDYLEIHPANWETQLDGCIAVGDAETDTMLENSADAFNRFMSLQNGVDQFILTVQE